jgi:hypothetical protein
MGRSHSREHRDTYLDTFKGAMIWKETRRLDGLISKYLILYNLERSEQTGLFLGCLAISS